MSTKIEPRVEPLTLEQELFQVRKVAIAMGCDQAADYIKTELLVRGVKGQMSITVEADIAAAAQQYTDTKCGFERDGKVCVKPPHQGKHTFRPKPHVAPLSKWQEVESFRVFGSGSKSYTLKVGSPCKVLGFGKKTSLNPDGSAQDGWTISKIEAHRDPEVAEINVTINKRGEHTRTVKSDKIVYVRPKKGSA